MNKQLLDNLSNALEAAFLDCPSACLGVVSVVIGHNVAYAPDEVWEHLITVFTTPHLRQI